MRLQSTSTCLTFAQQQQQGEVRGETCDANTSPGRPQPNTCIYKRTHLSHKLFRAPSHPPGKRHSETDAVNRHGNKGTSRQQLPLTRTASCARGRLVFESCDCQASILISLARCRRRSRSAGTRRFAEDGKRCRSAHFHLPR